MSPAIFLFAISFVLRGWAALLPEKSGSAAVHLARWLLIGAAAWLVLNAAGGWVPMFVPLIVAFGAMGILSRQRSYWRSRTAEGLVLLAGAWVSVPRLELPTIAALAIGFVGVGAVLDRLVDGAPSALRHVAQVILPAAAVLALLLHLQRPWIFHEAVEVAKEQILGLDVFGQAIGPAEIPGAERVVLEDGSTAWLDRPRGRRSSLGAVFFHGSDDRASRQPAALVIRRALLAAGFTVLSVDYPGFGGSPGPSADDPDDRWDPIHAGRAATEWLRGQPDITGIVLVGHSMGVTSVLRLLAEDYEDDGAVLLGGSLADPSNPEEQSYWYQHFLKRRGFTDATFPMSRWSAIEDRYLNEEILVRQAKNDRQPIVFVTFGRDWPNIVATRDRLYSLLPDPKTATNFQLSTHYLNASGRSGLVAGDVRTTNRLKREFAALRTQIAKSGTRVSSTDVDQE